MSTTPPHPLEPRDDEPHILIRRWKPIQELGWYEEQIVLSEFSLLIDIVPQSVENVACVKTHLTCPGLFLDGH